VAGDPLSPRPLERLGLTLRTAAHLRPAQIVHRVRLRSQRAALGLLPKGWDAVLRRDVPEGPGWPAEYRPIDAQLADGYPSAEDNARGWFKFLNEERHLGELPDWAQLSAPQLWRYHLHYLEWAWAFAAHHDRAWAQDSFARLWSSWVAASPPGRGDAWSPYVVSLRLWVLCGAYRALAKPETASEWRSQVDFHTRYLRAHVEHDVGGNHLIKNLKALIGAGVFLGSDQLIRAGCRLLGRQLPVQVLADGGHYERSPSYHCQVLGDLLDVQQLLQEAGHERYVPTSLSENLDRMQSWLGAMLMPDGDVPLFNDCVLVGLRRIGFLGAIRSPTSPLTILAPSGYVVMKPDERIHVVADLGPPCPPELPAHAHAGCLSFELTVDGQRVLVNSGTSTYEPSPRRSFERSTAAHNTVTVDGQDQSEVWGTFRAARLARPTLERAEADDRALTVTASHDGYQRLAGSPRHRRSWLLSPGTIEIHDEVASSGPTSLHTSVVRIHTPVILAGKTKAGDSIHLGQLVLSISGGAITTSRAKIATGFGTIQPGHVISATAAGPLPHRVVMKVVLTQQP